MHSGLLQYYSTFQFISSLFWCIVFRRIFSSFGVFARFMMSVITCPRSHLLSFPQLLRRVLVLFNFIFSVFYNVCWCSGGCDGQNGTLCERSSSKFPPQLYSQLSAVNTTTLSNPPGGCGTIGRMGQQANESKGRAPQTRQAYSRKIVSEMIAEQFRKTNGSFHSLSQEYTLTRFGKCGVLKRQENPKTHKISNLKIKIPQMIGGIIPESHLTTMAEQLMESGGHNCDRP